MKTKKRRSLKKSNVKKKDGGRTVIGKKIGRKRWTEEEEQK
jgi:hypothetical protein